MLAGNEFTMEALRRGAVVRVMFNAARRDDPRSLRLLMWAYIDPDGNEVMLTTEMSAWLLRNGHLPYSSGKGRVWGPEYKHSIAMHRIDVLKGADAVLVEKFRSISWGGASAEITEDIGSCDPEFLSYC